MEIFGKRMGLYFFQDIMLFFEDNKEPLHSYGTGQVRIGAKDCILNLDMSFFLQKTGSERS